MRVLIADDDPSLRFLCRAALESAGHEVFLAEDGLHVLQRVEDHDPQLLLMDVSMPYVGGLEVLRTMTAEQRDSLPVVLLSARARTTERMEGIEAGAIDYVTKPFRPESLIRVVDDVLAMTVDERRGYRAALLERLRGERLREGLSGIDRHPDAVSIDLRDGLNTSVQSLPKDEYTRRAARRQTAVASLALSAVTGAGAAELIDEMVFTTADVLAVRRVAVLEINSQGRLICRSVAGVGNLATLHGKLAPLGASEEYLHAEETVHVVTNGGLFIDEQVDHRREVWVTIPGCSGQAGVIVLECESDECPNSDDLRFIQVSAGIVSTVFHSATQNRHVRHSSISGFMRRKR